MNFMHCILFGITFFYASLSAQGLGFNIGPFSMQFNLDGSYYANDHRDVLDSPICYAIENHKKLDMIVESHEKVSSKEFRIVTKKLIVAPYAFGITQDGKPVLNGSVTNEKLIKEVTIKYGDDQIDIAAEDSAGKEDRGFFSGWFKSEKSENIDIRKISNLFVINDSRFDMPRDYKSIKGDKVRVICEVQTKDK